MAKFLNAEQRRRIRADVPEADWDKFLGCKHVAVSVSQRRLLDGDNDLARLTKRVSKSFPEEELFFATGKGSMKKLDQQQQGHAGRVTEERKDKGPPQVGG
jgi:hypothetical protein